MPGLLKPCSEKFQKFRKLFHGEREMGVKPKREEFEAPVFPLPREASLLCDLRYGLKTVSKKHACPPATSEC